MGVSWPHWSPGCREITTGRPLGHGGHQQAADSESAWINPDAEGSDVQGQPSFAATLRAIGPLVDACGHLGPADHHQRQPLAIDARPAGRPRVDPGQFQRCRRSGDVPASESESVPHTERVRARSLGATRCGPADRAPCSFRHQCPPAVFFGMAFDLKPNPAVRLGAARIIADDYFGFMVNGQYRLVAWAYGQRKPCSKHGSMPSKSSPDEIA